MTVDRSTRLIGQQFDRCPPACLLRAGFNNAANSRQHSLYADAAAATGAAGGREPARDGSACLWYVIECCLSLVFLILVIVGGGEGRGGGGRCTESRPIYPGAIVCMKAWIEREKRINKWPSVTQSVA